MLLLDETSRPFSMQKFEKHEQQKHGTDMPMNSDRIMKYWNFIRCVFNTSREAMLEWGWWLRSYTFEPMNVKKQSAPWVKWYDTRTDCPMRYLGLPLTIYRLRKTDLQPLEEKIVGKISMATWKNVNMAGCRVLVRAVLNSHAIYHLTSIALPKEVMKRIHSPSCISLDRVWQGYRGQTQGQLGDRSSRNKSRWSWCHAPWKVCHHFAT